MAMLIEGYEVSGTIALGQIYPPQKLRLLIDQTAKMREDPHKRKERIDKQSAIKFMATNALDIFVDEDGKEFSLEELLNF